MPPDTTAAESSRLTRCADALLDARRHSQWLPAWPAQHSPLSLTEAYAVQEAVAQRLGDRLAGWKLGCTSTLMQHKLGSDGPIAGRVFGAQLHTDGAHIIGARPDMLGLEAEFAFQMGADLLPRAEPYSRAEVMAATATLHPAIEQIESRFAIWQQVPIQHIVADNASHGRLVVGAPVAGWRDMDLAHCPIRLRMGDEVLAEGAGHHVLDDPLNALVWLANHLSARGLTLRRGEFVTTGTCTGLTFVPAGAWVSVDIAGGGSVRLKFAAATA